MITPFELPCVILCGGKSSRMGEDKSLLPFSSSNSLAQYQYERLKPYFTSVYVSSKINKFDFDINLILDKGKEFSPIVALETIFENIDSQKIFIITVDTPLVKIESIKKLITKSSSFDIAVAKTSRIHNLCGVFDKLCLLEIKAMLKNDIHKVGYLLKKLHTSYVNFPYDDEFINLNDKAEYKRAISLIS
jgi:molybdopterin-guanine dinucleotide biosynthesis protein A